MLSALLQGYSQYPCKKWGVTSPVLHVGPWSTASSSEVEAKLRALLWGRLAPCAFKALTDFGPRYFPSADLGSSSHKMKLRYSGVPMQSMIQLKFPALARKATAQAWKKSRSSTWCRATSTVGAFPLYSILHPSSHSSLLVQSGQWCSC